MALQFQSFRPRRALKLTGAFLAMVAFVLQPFVASNLPAAFAAPESVATTTSGFNSVGWSVDRTAPFAYSKVADKLAFTVDNTATKAPNGTTATFYKWEGFKSSALPAGTNTVRASLYIDPSWQNKPVSVSMWGVGSNGTDSSWPILAFSNGYTGSYDYTAGGFAGFRVYDTNTGLWANVLPASGLWGTTVDLEVTLNPYTDKYEFYVNGTMVSSYDANGYDTLSKVIFNNLNLKTDNVADTYYVKWTNFYTGKVVFSAPANLRLNGSQACGYITNVNSITPTWDAVPGAVSYNYKVTLPNGSTFGPTNLGNVTSVTGAFGGEGRSTFSVQAVAANGLTSEWAPACAITYDKTAPAVPTQLTPAKNTYVTTNDFYFDWSDSADNTPGVTYEFQSSQNSHTTDGVLDAGVWNNITNGNAEQKFLTDSTIHSTGAPDGAWYWQVRAIDAAGNKSAWTPVQKMTIDSQLPTVAITSASQDSGTQLSFNGYVNDTNFAYYYCWLTKTSGGEVNNTRDANCVTTWAKDMQRNGNPATSTNQGEGSVTDPVKLGGFTITDQEDGDYIVHMIAVDRAGNKSAEATFPTTVEHTPTDLSSGPSGNQGPVGGSEGQQAGSPQTQDSVSNGTSRANVNALAALLADNATDGAAVQGAAPATAESGDVLGASMTPKDTLSDTNGDVKGARTEKQALAWYWWVAIALAAIGVVSWLIAGLRRRSENI